MLTEGDIEAHREQYERDGYLLVKGVLSKEEASFYRNESHALLERLSRDTGADPTWGSASDVAQGRVTALKHCHDVQFQSAAFSRLLVDERLTDILSLALGGPNVALHHTKMFVKPPENGSPFPMHQDAPFFPHTKHTVAAAIVHFDDAPEEKGCVRVVPGSHREGLLQHRSKGGYHLPVEQYPLESAVSIEAEAGDVLVFGYFLVHGSGVNLSDEARTTLLVQFRDPEDEPTEDLHTESRGQGTMLRGVDPRGRRR